MSRIQVEQMSNRECLVFVRALRPFKEKKYRLEQHPNYKYLAEADKRYLRENPFLLKFNDEEIEAVRMKAVGEEGYVKPQVVDSARRRAREAEKRRKEKRLEKELAGERLMEADETKTKEALERDLRARENLPQMDRGEGLKGFNIEELLLVDDFDPVYEFEVV